jgi:hypothetical protein
MHPAVRRLLTIAAAGVAGLAALLFFASPASAHAPSITGSATCDQATGDWTVTWTVINDFGQVGTLIELTVPSGGGALTGIALNGTVPAKTGQTNGSITGTQTFPNSVNSATLSGKMDWPDTFPAQSISKTVPKPLACTYKVEQTCDSLILTFQAPPGAASTQVPARVIKLTPSSGDPQTITLAAGSADKVVTFAASAGFSVVVEIGENFKKTVTWSHDPCPTTTTAPPALAVTGSSLTGPVGIGAASLALGVGLIAALFVFRRRRTVAGR